MSGYLRRLASSARNPGQSIHPVVGSIFSGPNHETMPPTLEEESVVTGNQPERQVARTQEAPQLLLHEGETSPVRTRNAWPEMGPAKREGLEASAIRVVEEHTKAAIFKEQLDTAREAQAQQPLGPDSNPERRPAISRRLYEPLITESVPRTDNHRQIPRNASNPHKRDLASERQPDEIQIHIGRIEVTAVPPPASRPQTKPARKSLSLDEYLKRGRR